MENKLFPFVVVQVRYLCLALYDSDTHTHTRTHTHTGSVLQRHIQFVYCTRLYVRGTHTHRHIHNQATPFIAQHSTVLKTLLTRNISEMLQCECEGNECQLVMMRVKAAGVCLDTCRT